MGADEARERCERARACAARVEGLRRSLAALEEAMDEATSWHPGSGGGAPSGTGDPTYAAALSREGLADEIARARARLEEAEDEVGGLLRDLEAMRRAGHGREADVLEVYYVDLSGTWSEVAEELGVSLRTVHNRRDVALVWLSRHAAC